MKVLVTGATGFIGSHLVDNLVDKGYQVSCIIRKSSNIKWLANKKNIKFVEASYKDPNSLEKALKDIDYIYHCAGSTSAHNLEGYMEGNCLPTTNLIEAAIKMTPNLKRFLYISSQTAAGPALSPNEPTNEDMPMSPITDYGRSKKIAEEKLNSYLGKIPFTIVRPPAVYGPRDTEIFSIFKIVNMGIIPHIGFDKKLLSLVNIFDLCDGIITAAESINTLGKTYFISSEEIYNWDDVYQTMKNKLGKKNVLSVRLPHFAVLFAGSVASLVGKFSARPPVFNYQKGIDFIQKYWICSTKSATKDFGYRQKVSLEKGFEDTIKWYKDMKWL